MQKLLGTILMVAVGSGFNSNPVSTAPKSATERQTIEIISNQPGTLYVVGKGSEAVYMIECANRPLKLHVLNMPEGFSQDAAVTVSGQLKATHPLEDEWGEYFELTGIQPFTPGK